MITDNCSLAVIAPAVPTLIQFFAPIILATFVTCIVALPRWLLAFAYWLWCRNAPRFLFNRTLPGIRARVFQGVAGRQFADEYSFSVPDQPGVRERIAEFFERCGARRAGAAGSEFSRGSRFCTYFLPHLIPWRERDYLQRISVRTTRTAFGALEVDVRYVVQVFCMLRLQPAGLQNEVQRLYRELNRSPGR